MDFEVLFPLLLIGAGVGALAGALLWQYEAQLLAIGAVVVSLVGFVGYDTTLNLVNDTVGAGACEPGERR